MKWLRVALFLGTVVAAEAGLVGAYRNRPIMLRSRASTGRGDCDPILIAHGKAMNPPTWSRRRGGRSQFGCYHGYHLFGYKFGACSNNHWSAPFPVCLSNDCERPVIPGDVKAISLRRNAVLVFACDEGMVIDGHTQIFCQDQDWSGPPPKCIHGEQIPKYCPFTSKSQSCGWLNGYRRGLFWALHAGNFIQSFGWHTQMSVHEWAKIDNLPDYNIETQTSTKSSSTTRPPSTPTSPTSIQITTSTAYITQSSIPTIESNLSSVNASMSSTTPSTISTQIHSSSLPSSTLQPPSSSTSQPLTVLMSESSLPVVSRSTLPPLKAELVSPEYPHYYSGVCFRLQYYTKRTIPRVYLRVVDSVDVYLDPQNSTVHYKDRNWTELSFEVPPLLRPFRLVIVAPSSGVAVKNVRLEDTQCSGAPQEETPTTEPWTDATEKSTEPGTTEEWTTEQLGTTEIDLSTSTKLLPKLSTTLFSSSALPKSTSLPDSVTSVSTSKTGKLEQPGTTRRSPSYIIQRLRTRSRSNFVTVSRFVETSSASSSTALLNGSTTKPPKSSPFLTTAKSSNISADSSSATTLSPRKLSSFISKVFHSTAKILPFTSRKASSTTKKSSISKEPPATPQITSPPPKLSTPTTIVVMSTPTTPKLRSTPTLKIASSTNKVSSITTTTSTSTLTSSPSTNKVSSITFTTSIPSPSFSPTTSYSPTRTSTIFSTFPPTSRTSTVTSSELHERPLIRSSPSWTPFRVRLALASTGTHKPASTTAAAFINNQSMVGYWPGSRFKVRTIETKATSHPAQVSIMPKVEKKSPTNPGVMHGEIAMIVIGVAVCVGGVVLCLRKRFSWLQTSRMKLGSSYSVQINYADDVVGMDVLPTLANGRTRITNGNRVEESSADGEKISIRRKNRAMSGLSRLKGAKNYSELSGSQGKDYYDENVVL